jgi:phenylacetate-coenzyme A ligase PaaK-like adenylate-forming protein
MMPSLRPLAPRVPSSTDQPPFAWDELWFGSVIRPLWELSRNQWLPPERLSELQDHRVRALIGHAYARVPYYRQLFDARGLSPNDIRSVDDLARIPVLTRQVVLERRAELLAERVDPERCRRTRTNGTTGLPLVLYRTRAEVTHGNLTYLRALLANGFRVWDKQLFVTGAVGDVLPEARHWLDRLRRLRKRHIHTATEIGEQTRLLRAFQPDVIMGFNQGLRTLARAIMKDGTDDISPRLVSGGGDQVDDPTRTDIKAAFGVELCDKYGTSEADCVAWECPAHAGYHLSADSVVVEFLRDGRPARPGEAGHVIVTPLHLRAMPLIRYDLGDIATPMSGQCPCGRGLPRMQLIEGRTDSFITLPSGTVLPGTGTFSRSLNGEPSVVDWQVVQEDYDRIEVRMTVQGDVSATVARVHQNLNALLRHEATVRIEVVDRVRENPGAKMRRVVSRVPAGF